MQRTIGHSSSSVSGSHSQGPATVREDSRQPYSEALASESWVEVASRPSSSSLSSAATDEIVTTGLRVENSLPNPHRRRRRRRSTQASTQLSQRRPSIGSSQEEYEESESEEDHILTSSNENISEPHSIRIEDADADADDDDGNATALGISNGATVFAPQPHAFSPPPSSITNRHQMTHESYFPRTNASGVPSRSAPRRTTSQPQSRTQHSPFSALTSSNQPDHDAALRASLTTLLSCAAAARGLPKPDGPRRSLNTRVEPGPLRIVPESALLGSEPGLSSSSPSSRGASDQGKRKAPAAKNGAKDSRAVKKARRAVSDENLVSPTLLTWVVSAGVVVLVSAIGFSAGYAMGLETGRAEVGVVGEGSCGREAVKGGLRRLRWGTSGAASVRAL
ncbi:MAG: hypothetical protein M1814_004010 [Vezdaea aestivalis]|nr:MAG: hypothetical protein M1814_004010 [Vezdaea aestivalis]